MKILLFRHGLAMEREEAMTRKLDDSKRPLVEKGKERSRQMARFLARELGAVQVIATSPLLRAVQTAEIICSELRYQRVFELPELVPEAPPQAFARWLQTSIPRETSILVVGHEPQLSVFASWLLTGRTESFIELKKSGVIRLDVESFDSVGPSTAELRWLLTPKLRS